MKLTKFLKKIYHLGVKKERQIEKSISTFKHVQSGNRLRSQWQILAISYRKKKKKGVTQRQNQDSTRWSQDSTGWSQELWQTAHREWD